MTVRIIHLSDLHYPSLDLSVWKSVKQAVQALHPDLIIVSGDLVDQPFPDQLRWIGGQLNSLAKDAGAELFIVPGNHDVFEYGNAFLQSRKFWFETVFSEDGMPGGVIPIPAGRGVKPSGWSQLRRAVTSWWTKGRSVDQSGFRYPSSRGPRMVREPKVPVLLALLDSNPDGRSLAAAGGEVRNHDLIDLENEIKATARPHLVRIAVIHHHVIPIAHTDFRVVGNEQLMVLRNAGTVLDVLARNRFDLVLHGHKHRRQFTRIDLEPMDSEGYPMTVVSAGAVGLIEPNRPAHTGFNLIEVEDNGRIMVREYTYGHAKGPRIDGDEGLDFRTFDEPVRSMARRAYIRARDRHGLHCTERETTFALTENGDIISDHAFKGLRAPFLRGLSLRQPYGISIPPYGRLAAEPVIDHDARRDGCTIVPDLSATTMTRRQYNIVLPAALTFRAGATFRIHHEIANSLAMTGWEAAEREQLPDPRTRQEEWVGVVVLFPAGRLVLNFQQPPGVRLGQPYVQCERLAKWPGYDIDPETRHAIIPDNFRFIPDKSMREHAAQGLEFLMMERIWRLTIEQPVVGCRYRLCWEVPDDIPEEPIPSATIELRKILLKYGHRFHSGRPVPGDDAVFEWFRKLVDGLDKMLSAETRDELRTVTFFVYDGERRPLSLRPVVSWKSWSSEPIRADFAIPLGDGIAGAAFQQRRPVAWANMRTQSPLIMPIPYLPGEEDGRYDEQATICVPVYHDKMQDEERPSPWAAIGVIAYGSTSLASKIPPMCNRVLSKDHKELLNDVRAWAQTFTNAIVDRLAKPVDSADANG